ncbi:MAG: 6,7-dimethyl-8-ribityllumazine synthase [Patescibacteria group bacterium]
MQRKHHRRAVAAQNAAQLNVGIVVSDFNAYITGALLEGALTTLAEWKVAKKNITVLHVPGGFEIPLGCLQLLKSKKPDALIALGCVIKGETKHDEYISHAVAHALQDLMLTHHVPIGFGVLTPNSLAQAKARSRGKTNKGCEAAAAALAMIAVH